MGKIQDSFAVIVEDLKTCAIVVLRHVSIADFTSWYFRIWASVWLICAVTVFASVIVLGARATHSADNKSWTVWIEEKSDQYYPNFQFQLSTDEPNNVFKNAICEAPNGDNLTPENCDGIANCYSFYAADTQATTNQNGLVCVLNVTVIPGANQVLLFSIIGEDSGSLDQSMVAFAPNQNAWIMLTKNIKEPSGGSETDLWNAELSYHSTLSTSGQYVVNIKFSTFDVYHYEETTLYDRWASVCDIGGFAFFMYILHTMFMATVNVFLDNDSHFLGGAVKREYQNF